MERETRNSQAFALAILCSFLWLLGACSSSNPQSHANPQRTLRELPGLFGVQVVKPSPALRSIQVQSVLNEIHAEGDDNFDAWIQPMEGGDEMLVLKSPAFTKESIHSLEVTPLKGELRRRGYQAVMFIGTADRFLWTLRPERHAKRSAQ